MPLILPKHLPAIEQLKLQGLDIESLRHPIAATLPVLHIAVLNLMPLKEATETDLVRVLSASPLTIELTFVSLRSHVSKHTPAAHIDRFYTPFDRLAERQFDGMIVTGAPVEMLDFEQVDYWHELTHIMQWARTHVRSTLYICWAAQAALYHFYKIPKHPLAHKRFGVFEHHVIAPRLPIFKGFDDTFFVPHSRHTELRRADVDPVHEVQVISESDESGLYMMMAHEGKEFFITGHSEYAPDTLDREYRRDLSKGLDIDPPVHYYRHDDPAQGPIDRWRAHAHLLFSNWVQYYVCPQIAPDPPTVS